MQTQPTHQRQQIKKQFPGFEPIDGNFLYCPNQFFDVCLPNCSRGAVRIVAYVLRQTLGWLDSNGQPLQKDISISYSNLIQHAGVSRGAARAAIAEVIKKRFLLQTMEARCKAAGQTAQSAVFQLRWSRNTVYQKSFSQFEGFYTGEGCRTPVPNSFFDAVIPTEKLNVVKVTGAVIRHTVGYQNQFGGRNSSAPLSHRYIERYANISLGKAITEAIRAAESSGYIERVSTGRFNPSSDVRQPTCFRMRWCHEAKEDAVGSKIPVGESRQFNNPSRNGSKSPAAERSKNPTKEKTSLKDTNKQQVVAEFDRKSVTVLKSQGFDETSAIKIAKQFSFELVKRQVDWLDARNPTNRVAMLRTAIEQDWSMPTGDIAKEKIRESRIRDQQQSEKQLREVQDSNARKLQRNDRRGPLISEWGSADTRQRRIWLAEAVKNETSESIIRIISRQHEQTETPHMNVLNLIAADRGLPPLFDTVRNRENATLNRERRYNEDCDNREVKDLHPRRNRPHGQKDSVGLRFDEQAFNVES